MFWFHFQTKAINAHAYADLSHSHDGDRNWENNQLIFEPISFTVHSYLYWLANLLIAITFLYWQVFQMGENKPTKQPNLKVNCNANFLLAK